MLRVLLPTPALTRRLFGLLSRLSIKDKGTTSPVPLAISTNMIDPSMLGQWEEMALESEMDGGVPPECKREDV